MDRGGQKGSESKFLSNCLGAYSPLTAISYFCVFLKILTTLTELAANFSKFFCISTKHFCMELHNYIEADRSQN